MMVPLDPGNARFVVRESVQQLHVTHALPGSQLTVYDRLGASVQTGTVDKLGSLIFRKLDPGSDYVVRTVGNGASNMPEYSRLLTVMSPAGSLPPQGFYDAQTLKPGFGYIKTRDGTPLSIYVTLPGPIEKGPYPTVVDYSGYSPSKPGQPLGDYGILCLQLPTLCDAPNDPSGLVVSLLGYATVSVNIRGTGCSGGAYDYFETLQLLDGYDVIETVAAQPWVQFHKVGMVGLSYPGITQLFVATTRPPGLAAISPLSVIGNSVTTLRPGGILNSGFATAWINGVLNGADPYGQGWEKAVVDGGDLTCAENQLLHGQKVDNVAQAYNTPFYVPEMADPLNPTFLAPQIEVPLFLSGAWEDEQTGPFFVTLLNRFTGSPLTRFTVYNGIHRDGFAPQVLAELAAFLDLYVARRVPTVSSLVRSLVPQLTKQAFGVEMPLPADRFGGYSSYADALAAYQKEPVGRAIFESGGGMDPGAPAGVFERSFTKWPAPEVGPYRLYLHSDGSLGESQPSEADAGSSFLVDANAGQRGILQPGGSIDDKLPKYDYRPLSDGHAVAFLTAPLAKDLVMMGTASADLWIKSTADEADLQVSITEVRPDGQEMYVQSGWLRASHRAVGADSTELWPSQTHLEKDAALLQPGQWVQARVAIPGFGHVFRARSRIRVSVDTPGGTRAEWRFLNTKFPGDVTQSVAHAQSRPSSIALPLLAGATAPSPLPICPSLRGQPCRLYIPITNSPAK